jgi:hypothetical protein
MDSTKIKTAIVLLLTSFIALYLGVAAATAQIEATAWIVGGLVFGVCIALGRRILLLLPLMTGLGIVLPLPGNMPTLFLVQFLVLGFYAMLFLMRKLPFEIKLTELEIICLLYLAMVLQAYLRNPVGLNIFGGDTVGGKAYVILAVAFSTAALLSTLRINPNDLKWWVRLTLIGSLANFALGAAAKVIPSVGYILGASFSTDVADGSELAAGQASRVSFVRGISNTIAIWVASKISPLKACFSPLYGTLILISVGFAAISGFRIQLIGVGIFLLIGIAYRGGLVSVVISFVLGVSGLAVLSLVNVTTPLPANIQRSLTFLPGAWEERYKEDAAGSTEWRVEMWKEALLTEKWIANKWLGDGLGFSKAELNAIVAVNASSRQEQTISGLTSGQENFMISGGYHSGPVVTIRTIGYVGLFVLIVGFIRLIIHAHRQIIRCRGSEWYSTVLFICIPIIAGPITWTFLYGTFDGGAGILAMGCAMVRILERNLPLPAYVLKRREPYLTISHRQPTPNGRLPVSS